MHSKFTKEEYAQLRLKAIEMRKNGMFFKKIARELGIALSTVREYVHYSGLPPAVPKTLTLAERYVIVREMRANGRTRFDIADAFGLSPYTIDRYLRDVMRGSERIEERKNLRSQRKRSAREERAVELRPMRFKPGQRFEDVKFRSRI